MSAPHAGTFTAASGVHIHRGDALPAADRGSIFVCESAQNLVQRQVLTANGVTFTSRPARTGRDFLVVARHLVPAGLRGQRSRRRALHRRHVPPDHRPSAVRAGAEPRAARFPGGQGARTDLSDRRRATGSAIGGRSTSAGMSAPELAAHARAPECVVAGNRAAAARRAARPDGDPAPPRASRRTAARDVARLHALWTLDGLDGLETADIAAALQDPHAGVRENAVRLAGSRIGDSEDLLTRVVRLADDADDRVRLQVALALGESRRSACDRRPRRPRAARRSAAVDARRDPQLRARSRQRLPARVRRITGVIVRPRRRP